MKQKIVSILIRDCLELKNSVITLEQSDVIAEFVISEVYQVIYIHDNKIHTSNIAKKDLQEKLIVEDKKYTAYYEKNQPLKFTNLIPETNDIVSISTLSGIPLSRLTNDYDSIHMLSTNYQNILEEVYSELGPIITSIGLKTILTESTHNKNNYFKLIREFISNELS